LAGGARIPEGRGDVQQRISGKTVEKRMAVTKVAIGLKPFNSFSWAECCGAGTPVLLRYEVIGVVPGEMFDPTLLLM
jgi:hypothetical protein